MPLPSRNQTFNNALVDQVEDEGPAQAPWFDVWQSQIRAGGLQRLPRVAPVKIRVYRA